MRALMHPVALNLLLSMYCGTEQSRNALVICAEVATSAPGEGKDRARLYHRREFAISFRREHGQWWWVDDDIKEWQPTIGRAAKHPPLSYMDVGAIFVPAEIE